MLPKNQIVVHPEQSSRTASVPEAPALQRSCARRSTDGDTRVATEFVILFWRVFSLTRGSGELYTIYRANLEVKSHGAQRKDGTKLI
jgi:hypothetical protein